MKVEAIDLGPPTPSRSDLERRFAPQFEACDDLLAAVWTDRPTALDRLEGYVAVLLQTLGRAITTYRAVLVTCRAGLPDQGLMLSRSLYEDLIAAHWAALPSNREIVWRRLVQQEQHTDDAWDQLTHEFWGTKGRVHLSEEERAELDTLFAGGTKSWFGRLSKARKDIEDFWVQRGGDVRTLDFLDRIINKRANMHLHNTVEGLYRGAQGSFRHGELFYPGYGQTIDVDERAMQATLYAASIPFVEIAVLVLDELALERRRVQEAARGIDRALSELMPSQRVRLGRNDPCWCGSGLKLKKCHVL